MISIPPSKNNLTGLHRKIHRDRNLTLIQWLLFCAVSKNKRNHLAGDCSIGHNFEMYAAAGFERQTLLKSIVVPRKSQRRLNGQHK